MPHVLTRMRIGRMVIAATVAAVALVGVGTVPASAHSQLESSSPADGAVLESAPAVVTFTFDEEVLEGTDTISVNDAQGNAVTTEPSTREGSTISIPWPASAAAGTYQVAYRVVSGDGHPVTGAITITISSSSASPAPTSSPSASQAPEPARGIAGGLVVLIGIAILVLAAVAGVTLWRRRRN